MDLDAAAREFREFVAVVKALRTPGTGCPWDLEQTHDSLRPYLVEETYEVLDALDRGDDDAFRDELSDLLLQVVLHAQLAADRGAFAIADVVRGITEKMIRRHPHVFGSEQVSGSAEVLRNWDKIKAYERRDQGGETSRADALARLPEGLPALLRSQRLGEKAARAHFDWDAPAGPLGKVREELAELEHEVAATADGPTPLSDDRRARLEHELGDVLFSLCQLARWLGLNAEESLRACNRRFVERFRRMEHEAPRPLPELSKEELAAAWEKAKGQGRGGQD